MLSAIRKELVLRKAEVEEESLHSLYIGGGTPSLMNPVQLKDLLNSVKQHYRIDPGAEVTLEANPDDLDMDYLMNLKHTGINRLSIGIQSFHDDELAMLNRRHNADRAKQCLADAAKAGFENLSIDLIYGLPESTNEKWEKTLKQATLFSPVHISAYHLSYEPGTVLFHRKTRNKIKTLSENQSLQQYIILADFLEKQEYEHYEISSFARRGCRSRHNMAYWTGEKYLGFGPSAHSYDGHSRKWNLPRNRSYIRALKKNRLFSEVEKLDSRTKYHDYLLTGLRTSQGVDPEYILCEWGKDYFNDFNRRAEAFMESGKMLKHGQNIALSREGLFISDHIIAEFFIQPEGQDQ